MLSFWKHGSCVRAQCSLGFIQITETQASCTFDTNSWIIKLSIWFQFWFLYVFFKEKGPARYELQPILRFLWVKVERPDKILSCSLFILLWFKLYHYQHNFQKKKTQSDSLFQILCFLMYSKVEACPAWLFDYCFILHCFILNCKPSKS